MSNARNLANLLGTSTQVKTAKVADEVFQANKSLVINGDCSIAQRGTSVTGITARTGGYDATDRFFAWISSLGTWTIEQSTDAPTGFSHSHKLTCTTANASPAAGAYVILGYYIEAQDLQHLEFGTSSAKSVTVSFWVKSNKTGDATFQIMQDDNSRKSQSPSYTINSANTWEYKTLTFVGDTSGLINDDNGRGFELNWWLNSGSTYDTGTNQTSWTTLNNADRNASNLGVGGTDDDYLQIAGIKLEVGSVATPFRHESYEENLAKCQRYYQRIVAVNTASGFAAGTSFNNLSHYFVYHHPVTMRANPSIGKSALADLIVVGTGTSKAPTTFARQGGSPEVSEFLANTATAHGAAGNGVWMRILTAGKYVDWSAEL